MNLDLDNPASRHSPESDPRPLEDTTQQAIETHHLQHDPLDQPATRTDMLRIEQRLIDMTEVMQTTNHLLQEQHQHQTTRRGGGRSKARRRYDSEGASESETDDETAPYTRKPLSEHEKGVAVSTAYHRYTTPPHFIIDRGQFVSIGISL